MCYVLDCNAPNSPDNKNFGIRIDVCEKHYDECRESIRKCNPDLEAKYVNDYARLFAIIQNKKVIGEALDTLAIPLRTFKNDRRPYETEDLPNIHWLLKRREIEFGFNKRDIIMTGILDADWFLKQLTDGYASVDYGADADHGPFTHRFQWYAIMYVWSNGFTRGADNKVGWGCTVIELYKMLGDPTTLHKTPLRQCNSGVPYPGSSLWSAMFDLGGHYFKNYSFPDVLHKDLRNADSNLLKDDELRNEVLDLQRIIVYQRVKVLSRLEVVGAVKPERNTNLRIKQRPEVIEAAVTGSNILGLVRYDPDVEFFDEVEGGPAQKAMAMVNKEYALKLVGSGLWEDIGVNLIGRKLN